jgi:endonuclease YncB( thermonuclease family)
VKQLNLRLKVAALVAAAVIFGAFAGSAHAQSRSRPLLHPPFKTAQKAIFMRCDAPRVYDGDTLICKSGYSLRMLGIQAPEIKCRRGIECVAGDAVAARDSLILGMAQGRLSYQYVRRDNRNRPVVIVRAGNMNLSCWQLSRTDAILKFDHRRQTERECSVRPGTNRPASKPDEDVK